MESKTKEERTTTSTSWIAPYLPGDRPQFSDENGKLRTKKDIERMIPPTWEWIDDKWTIEKGIHCDNNGWQYGIGMISFLCCF